MSLLIHSRKVTAYSGPPRDTTNGGEFIACGNGHRSASVSRGYDPGKKDWYVEATCRASGCDATSLIYDKDRRVREV